MLSKQEIKDIEITCDVIFIYQDKDKIVFNENKTGLQVIINLKQLKSSWKMSRDYSGNSFVDEIVDKIDRSK